METERILGKGLVWIVILGLGCNGLMQGISYYFYKGAKHFAAVEYTPEYIQFNENLSGYGYNLTNGGDQIILYFGGSNYIAYNSVGCYGGTFASPFVAADFYGSQKSKGKLNLKSMKNTAVDLYDWVKANYPEKKIVVMGHSYATGIAAYLASVKDCDYLILMAAYRDLSDLYNQKTPIFFGPGKFFITNNIRLSDYAPKVTCDTYIIGSHADQTLNVSLQRKVKDCFADAQLKIFDDVTHDNYLREAEVIEYINESINSHLDPNTGGEFRETL